MLSNLHPRLNLIGLARKNSKKDEFKRLDPAQLAEAQADGWQISKKNKKSILVSRKRRRPDELEARVWTLFYKMGFLYLSGKGGCRLQLNAKDPNGPSDQIDVVAADGEVAIAVECKSAEEPKKDSSLPSWLSRFGELKKRFGEGVRHSVEATGKRHVGMVAFTWDIILTDNDRDRAQQHQVVLFDYSDLEYFEALVSHLGAAARYQFLCEIFRGMPIHGLEICVPALRTKMGRKICYNFSIKPEYLLKIAYVAHRAKGKAIDVDMYQRMISRSRLRKIAAFISDGGSFPTNIVVNIRDKRYVEFSRGEQQTDDDEGALFGWLTLRPAYGCAWVIDGQHRLFAYSGHDFSGKAHLNTLAYEALSSSDQAQMFVDINSEQRKVKRSLLVELDADLKWNADEEEDRIQAIISKAGLALDSEIDSPLRDRILLADVKRTDTRCISLTSISAALSRPGLFVIARKKDITEYGPLWRPDQVACLKRTISVVKAWFATISTTASSWWAIGSAEGGGLAMNNGVTVSLNVMRSVMEHLGYSSLRNLDTDELIARLDPYARSLAAYFARMTAEDRQRFRQLQGSDGQIMGTRQCQEAISADHPKYSPPQLQEWIESRKKNFNDEGRRIIEHIETVLQTHVLQILKSEYDVDGEAWWWEGVPKNVRKRVDERMNDADGRPGSREQNFDLIHYREIIVYNWDLFKDLFGRAEDGASKDKQTSWIKQLGDMRNIVMHPSRQQFLTTTQIQTLQGYDTWLKASLQRHQSGSPVDADGASEREESGSSND
jgi:DNA sulfur modification protein DndB